MQTRFGCFKLQGLAFIVSLTFLCSTVSAQTTGRIVGKVTDSESGDFLPGANVVLEGTTIGSATDAEGNYRILRVPPGIYTLKVSYIGYESYSAQVQVVAGEELRQEIGLAASYVAAEEVVVTGIREGQVKALSQQRTAVNIKNVVARELMETFPDMNTAEVLQRVPGVNLSRSLGEGRFVSIRGTAPNFTTVQVNGERIATPEDEERFVALDVISANQLASIEVTKAITPDMDGDAVGGVINLVTRSGFDSKDRYARLTFGSGYSELSGKPNYQGAFTFNQKFGQDNKFGFSLSGNWQRQQRATHGNEMRWGDREDVNDNTIPFALREIELRDYLNKRTRYGFSSRLEYRPSSNTSLYVSGMVNIRDDDQRRNEYRIRIDKGDYLSRTQVEGARLIRGLQDRVESQTIIAVNGGGAHNFGNLGLDYRIAYSYGEQTKDFPDGQIRPEFQMRGVDLALDLSDTQAPRFTPTNLTFADLNNPDNFEIDAFDFRAQNTTDEDLVGSLNFKIPYSLGNATAEFKFGGKLRTKTKDRNNERFRNKWKGDDDLLMSQFAGDMVDDFQDGDYNFGPGIDRDRMREFFLANKDNPNGFESSIREDETFGETYDAGEDVYSYYLMTTINFGKVLLLGGVRQEFTNTDYTGTLLEFNEDGDFVNAAPQADSRSYNNFFPNFQLRYQATPRTNLRFAATTGIARANYFDLVPFLWVIPEDQELLRGNSKLDPTTSVNLDLLAEHFLQNIGILAGGVFYKRLDDIIFTANFKQEGGPFDGFDVEQPINGGSATLWGFELNWQQQFTFLPGFLSGFGIFANYTHTEATDVELILRERSDKLPGQASDAANVALTYQKNRLNARLAFNLNGKFIDEVGSTADTDEWRDDYTQLDFSAIYRLTRGLDLFLGVINITNAARLDYLGIESRTIERQFYSFQVNGGVRWRL